MPMFLKIAYRDELYELRFTPAGICDRVLLIRENGSSLPRELNMDELPDSLLEKIAKLEHEYNEQL